MHQKQTIITGSNMRYLFIPLFFIVLAMGIVSCKEKKDVQQPNILFVISDDQSYPHAGAYGYQTARTPAFDKIAKEGVLFTNAFSPAPGCSPSRASILTGRHIWQLEEAGSHAGSFPSKYICYPDLLEQAGYFVGFTGKGWAPGNWKISGRKRNPAGNEYSSIIDKNAPRPVSKIDYAANFEAFLSNREHGQPFCFWYGAYEPHRGYEKGIGARNGFDINKIKVPPFLPDADEVRNDMADYLFEIEHFDKHLGRMLQKLEEIGELDNTLIIVTSDNGMPFPRAKANLYEYGFHMPLAVRWGDKVKGGRIVNDLISLTDIAPTILNTAGVRHPSNEKGQYAMSGKSFLNILLSQKSGFVDTTRTAIYAGRERHSSSRWKNLSYPIRAIRTKKFLYIRNFKPERWPAGAPEKLDKDGNLLPGYHDIDHFTKRYTYIHRDNPEVKKFFELAVSKRPKEELYDISVDKGCINNLAKDENYSKILERLRKQLQNRLIKTKDPRIMGNGDIWESYTRYSPIRTFPVPDWNKSQLK